MDKERSTDERLSSWKEIAGYFRVSVRTVQRWEREEGLPISRHRHSRLSSVFAGKSQLEQWWTNRPVDETSRSPASHQPKRVEVRRSIAVLPFNNLNQDLETEILADGLTDELIGRLGQIQGLWVTARTSSFCLKHERVDARIAGERLGAEYILEGSVRKSGERLRINSQLVRTADGCLQWAKQIDRPMRELLDIQQEIARGIADELELNLSGTTGGVSLSGRGTHDIEAHRLYLKGQHFYYGRRPRGLQTALECFEQAVAIDPNFAAAWARIAECHVRVAIFALGPIGHSANMARTAARRALAVDEANAEAHATLAFQAAVFDYDWVSAEQEFRHALRLRPEAAEIHGTYSAILMSQGRFAEAEIEIAVARRTDPLGSVAGNSAGFLALCQRQYERAAGAFLEVLQRESTNPYALYWLAETRLLENRFDEAAGIASEIGMPAFGAGIQAYSYYKVGRNAEAVPLRRKLETLEPEPAVQIALGCLGKGDFDGTFHWLGRAVELHSLGVHWIKVDPIWDQVRPDSRFRALLERIHLTD